MANLADEVKLKQNSDGKWYNADGKRVWRAGSLVYTRRGLAWLLFWLLLGDFTNTLAVTSIPMMLPLHLKNLNYTTTQIAWFTSIGYLACMIVIPLTGMWSDRIRTRWGRRRPFVLFTAPLWGIGMLMIPYMKTFWGMNLAVAIVSVAGATGQVMYYFFNDVIPGELMGRFIGAFRFIGFGGTLVFQYGVFRLFDSNPVLVWWLCGIIGVTFNILMLIMIKEGDYPPPPEKIPILNNINMFVKEGLCNKFMWMLLLTLGMTALGAPAANTFYILFFKTNLNMTSNEIGMMMGTGTIIAMALAIPAGWIVDRYGPNIIWGLFGAIVGGIQILMYFFILDKYTCWPFYLVYSGFNMILGAALLPMMFAHLPKEKFGQLVSVQTLISMIFLFLGTMSLGWIIKMSGDFYRFSFLYGGIIYCLVPVFLWLMLRFESPFAHLETSMGRKSNSPNQAVR
ncbi:MAG: Major facilitator superfamily [Parcubacteria group bacterium GW2011_GWA2_43_17]|nr:MAG: Major facilitator superfamily [Parcubacteria group bacterium GW2011_GWA2_43_17]OHB45134.1 MAG: hypothetical protein A2Y13_06890 [Planctomycetes bacterium GWC2_45_44]